MTREQLEGFTYRLEPGAGPHTLLLLHGTGGNEDDMLGLARMLDPDASLLSPRGRVVENGMPRFFRRFEEGVLDVDDLKRRTHELAAFILAAGEKHGFDRRPTAVGYSNGANIAASLLLLHPRTLEGAALLRPMFPYEPDEPPDLGGVRVFIAAGRRDPLIPIEQPEMLASILEKAGASVSLNWSNAGHPLQRDDVERARAWLVATA